MRDLAEYKSRLCDIGRRMYQREFVAANDGNISCRIGDNEILITPTGVSKGFMTPEMIVRLNLDGEVLEGGMKPSSETAMHVQLYGASDSIGAIVHAHPLYATLCAIIDKPLDQKLVPEAILLLGSVPVAKYGTPSTDELPNEVKNYIHDHKAVLLANHGALSWGKDLEEAYLTMERVEFMAKLAIMTKDLDGVREISPDCVQKLMDLNKS